MLPDFELCCSKFAEYGFNLTEEQYKKFDIYAEFLVEYNKNVNLTAITEPQEILVKHFIDSVLMIKFIDFPNNFSLIDVGTGAGFPSIPMKIMRPDIEICLLDSLAKRISFLELLCSKLEIKAEYIHGRAENVAKMPEYREKFDFSCARAVANLAVLSEYCLPFVKEGGYFLALKGPSEKFGDAEKAVSTLGGEYVDCYEYSLEADNRKIFMIRKISHTPTKYPRNSAQIKRKSL